MTDRAQQFHISRLEKEKGRRTKCFVKIASYHLMGKRASSACIANAKGLIKYRTEYRKLNTDKERTSQALTELKNEIAFLNDCLRIAVEKDSSGELINLLELEKLENSIKEDLFMKERISFDDLPSIGASRGFKRKKKLSIFDKALFGKFSRGYTRPEDCNPKTNNFIPTTENKD
jgi:hypothetical protein